MKLLNKTALITGGARGIGLATVQKFLQEGANVVLLDLKKEDIEQGINKLGDFEKQLAYYVGDVTNKESVTAAIDYTVDKFGQIDILVNNAGITADAQLLKMEDEQWDKVIDVNLKGVFQMTRAAAAKMKEQKSGVILNASSVVGLYGNFGQTNYAAAKFGINGMTKTWAKELGRYKVRVNSVAPGFIQTEMTAKIPEKVLKMMEEKSVLNEMGKPEDIANAYAFLASDEARYITGTVLSVDGGVVV
ncbi:3-oxoacyl-[acyl-carrier-protein] reductase [Salinibacillus xinjiangensis]|uniref:3-oxoacyl-[acyl-carrier-protein] reductase n=1 Tax=Salinibacillus xinjiangensis TaxID=1229268 RepID=A0A6G1X9F1_9BACI|nr:3-oxoacyl-[acyl-carrier-protein] reductase [Salinibacillus xinjiangensis]MRG87572.1 3-oxoacyl-[acyl-carrier-protein] reductase [Salinibacillus xinjiangensis]